MPSFRVKMHSALVFLTLAGLLAGSLKATEPVFEAVAPGVLAVLQPPGHEIQDANSIVITTSRGVIVVDAPTDREFVDATLARIEGDIDQPVRFVVNTHWHTDHTQSNHVYRERYGDDLLFVGHRSLTHDVPERASAMVHEERERLIKIVPLAEEKLAEGLSMGGEPLDEAGQAQQRAAIDRAKQKIEAYADVHFLPPDLTYDRELSLHLGDTEIRLLHFGAHTDGDTVVYLPRQRVLLTGDLLDVMPFAGHGYPRTWITTLETLEALDIEKIVPGHGPVFQGKAQLLLLRDYFQTIVDGVDQAIATGATAEQAIEKIDLNHFRKALAGDSETLQRNFDQFAPETIERAYALASEGAGDSPTASN